MEYKCDRCSSIFTEWYRLEIHRQVHDRKSKIKEYGSAEFNDYCMVGRIVLDIESILLVTVARLEGIFYRTQPFT